MAPRQLSELGKGRLEHREDRLAELGAVRDHPVPVSYTHLRAPETVLALVCRLLLEKKKQNTTSTI